MPMPNVLWICTDSQRFDTLGCYGNPFVRSPNVDRLAQRGMLFENCFAQSPLCTPSRGAFLTGRYPVTMRLRQNGQSICADEVPITRTLADHEYICGLSGKLHLSPCNRRFTLGENWRELGPEEELIQGVERRIDDGYAEFWWDHCPNTYFRSSSYHRWLQEQGTQFRHTPRPDSRVVFGGMPSEHHQSTFCADKAISFIESREGYRHPWLFSVNPFDPHSPFDPPAESLAPYLERLEDIPLPNYVTGELEGKPFWQTNRHRGCNYVDRSTDDVGDPYQHRLLRAAYWAMCDLLDVQVGRILDALDRSGQADNTLVIFTSDHGELLGDHGCYIKGPFLYDPCIQVPLIVSWPGVVAEGVRSSALVELTDLAPTILDAVGLPRNPGMQARSLWPLLTGREDPQVFREDIYCEYYNANPDPAKAFLTMLRTDRYKLIRAHGTPMGELYDLGEDPTETRNLWDDPALAAVKMELLLRMSDRMAWTADPLPERTGIY